VPYDPITGLFTLVEGNPVVTGTVISSTWANNTLSDIADALGKSLSDYLPRSGSKAMSGALQATFGNNVAPGLNFGGQGSANSGIYYLLHGPSSVAIAQGGVAVAFFSNGAILANFPIWEPTVAITTTGAPQQLSSASSVVVVSCPTSPGELLLPISFPASVTGAFSLKIIKKDAGQPLVIKATAPASLNGVSGGVKGVSNATIGVTEFVFYSNAWYSNPL
jgi:hypothetical protein